MAQRPTITSITRPPDPSTPSSSYTAMRDRLRILRIVYGGTAMLRAGGEEFLPKFAKETAPKYEARKKAARLRRNMFRQSVDRITGRIFEVPIKLNPPEGAQAVPDLAKVIADDADLRGSSLDRVGRDLYKEALKLGMHHCLVDYPIVTARNLAEERAQAARPYLVMLAPEQVIRAYEDAKGNTTHVAWVELTTEWSEVKGEEVVVKRIQERFPGRWKTWVENAATGWSVEGEGALVVPGPNPSRIMFHTLYAEEEEHMVARTPLTEVADLTIEHFQIASSYRNALIHNLFPIMTATGVKTKDISDVVMGPETILGSENKDAKFDMLEHKGNALEAGFKDLESLEQRAEAYAGRLTKPSGDVKATTEAISSAEVSSFAKDMAQELEDTLQAILDDMALWSGVASLGNVEVNMDFAVDLPDGDLQALQSARSNGDISRNTLWKELSRRNVLARDFDPEEEERLLEEQEAEAMEREQEAMKFAASLEPQRPPPPGA